MSLTANTRRKEDRGRRTEAMIPVERVQAMHGQADKLPQSCNPPANAIPLQLGVSSPSATIQVALLQKSLPAKHSTRTKPKSSIVCVDQQKLALSPPWLEDLDLS